MENSFLEEWLVEILVAILIAIALGVLAMVGSLREVIRNGLQDRMAKAETWIEWLIQDRITEARQSGRTIAKPPQDVHIAVQEIETRDP